MASETQIANLALSHIGVSKRIANILTEQSAEARICNVFYDQARDETLRAFSWPFATKFVALGLVEENPTDEWDYSYQMPTDCLRIRRMLSGNRNDTEATKVPYKLVYGTAGTLIYTDKEDAEIEYTVRADDPTRYPADFVMAFSLLLATFIAPSLTSGDPFQKKTEVLRLYFQQIAEARSTALNEEVTDDPPESEFIRARD